MWPSQPGGGRRDPRWDSQVRFRLLAGEKHLFLAFRVKSKAVWGPERREEEATEESLSTLPLLGDPYEERTVEVATSGVGGGGEGLFARRQLEEGELVAIYNGVKVPLLPGAGKEDWDECGYSIGYFETSNSEHGWGDMDIPKAFRNSESYRSGLSLVLRSVMLFFQGHPLSQVEPQFPEQLSVFGYPASRLWISTVCSHYKEGLNPELLGETILPSCRLNQAVSCLSIINIFFPTARSGTKNCTTSFEHNS